LRRFTYGNGIASRMIPGHPFSGSRSAGVRHEVHGGNYATPHAQYYKNTIMKDVKAPDHGNLDILEEVIPKAKKHGVKVYTWSEDVWRNDVPNVDKIQERDLYGRNARTVCFNNPDHHNFLLGLMEDFTRSYDLDGIMWGSERYGAFGNMVESVHNRNGNDPSRVTCFCQFCQPRRKRVVSTCQELLKDSRHWKPGFAPAAAGSGRPMGTMSRCGAFCSAIRRFWPGNHVER